MKFRLFFAQKAYENLTAPRGGSERVGVNKKLKEVGDNILREIFILLPL